MSPLGHHWLYFSCLRNVYSVTKWSLVRSCVPLLRTACIVHFFAALTRSLTRLLASELRKVHGYLYIQFIFLAHVLQGHPLHRETTNIISSNLVKNVSSNDYEKKKI